MPNGASQRTYLPQWLKTVLIGRRPKATIIRLVILVTTSAIVFGGLLLPARITGPSMLPTYQDGSINFVNRTAYLFHEPRRGDIVGIRFSGTSMLLCKRVIALPGETIEFVRGHVRVNGRFLDEPYIKLPCDWNQAPLRLGITEYYVVGDNRSMPIDGHTKGAAHRDRIVGKMLL